MNAVENLVKCLISKELNTAIEKHYLFASPHEGYGVLKEEIEEAQEKVKLVIEAFDIAWKHIKKDKDAEGKMKLINKLAMEGACEMIQVAAMAQKYIMSFGNDDE